jgi:cytochrome c-type biogenesis protein CcmE
VSGKQKVNMKVVLAGVAALVCGVLVLASLAGSTVSTVPFGDVPQMKDRLEVYGKLDRQSIRPLRGATLVAFDLVEEGTGRRLSLLYDNPATGLPANFPAASHARAAGLYDPTQNKVIADRVLTKCPSKYKEENLDVATRSAVEKWQQATGANGQGS